MALDPRIYEYFKKQSMDPSVRQKVGGGVLKPLGPSSFDVSPSASTAPTAGLMDRQVATMPPPTPNPSQPGQSGFKIQSPFKSGGLDDFTFRRDTGRLDLQPAKQEVMPVSMPDPDIPGKDVKKPIVSEPEGDMDPAGLDTPESDESPMQKAYGEYEALLKSRADQLSEDMAASDKGKWPKLIAMALAGYGDALVATSGGQSDFLGKSMAMDSDKRDRLERRRAKLSGAQDQMPILKARAEESKMQREAALIRESKSQRRHDEKMGFERRGVELSERTELRGIEATKQKAITRKENIKLAGQTVTEDLGRGINLLERNLKRPGKSTAAGMIGTVMQYLPESDADELEKYTTSVKSNISIDRLQAMREASPTGGALGQIPVQQQRYLMQLLGSLEIGQKPHILNENMKRIHNIYQDMIHGKGKGPERFGLPFDPQGNPIEQAIGMPVGQNVPHGTMAPPPVGTVEDGMTFQGGDPGDPANWGK